MKYIVYSEVDKIRNDFSIKMAKYLSKDVELTLIDLDSKNRDLAIELDVAENTIYDVEDCLSGLVEIDQAKVKVSDNFYLLSSSVIDKYDFSKEINFEIDNYIILTKNKNILKRLKGRKYVVTNSLIDDLENNVVSYDLNKKDLKDLSKKSNLVAYKGMDSFIENAIKGNRIVFNNIFEKILEKLRSNK